VHFSTVVACPPQKKNSSGNVSPQSLRNSTSPQALLFFAPWPDPSPADMRLSSSTASRWGPHTDQELELPPHRGLEAGALGPVKGARLGTRRVILNTVVLVEDEDSSRRIISSGKDIKNDFNPH
jgi:hypothetical protein